MKLKELHSLMQVCWDHTECLALVSVVVNPAAFWLQDIQIFQQPKIELEQYATGPDIASRLLFTVSYA